MCDHEQGCNCQACPMRERNDLEVRLERSEAFAAEQRQRAMPAESRQADAELRANRLREALEACLHQMERHKPAPINGEQWDWGDTVPFAREALAQAEGEDDAMKLETLLSQALAGVACTGTEARELACEVERLREVVRRAYDDNENLRRREARSLEDWKSLCAEAERLRALLAEIEKLSGNTYCGDIAQRAREGSE